MMNLNPISTPQLILSSNSFTTSPLYCNTSIKTPSLLIRKPLNLSLKAVAVTTDGFYTKPPKETFYDVLGIPESGTPTEIKRAYKQMALKYHPDVSPPDQVDEYTSMFILVQKAYETLSDPESRAMYDFNLANGLHLAFSAKKGSGFGERPDELPVEKRLWEEQVEELKRRSMEETDKARHGGRMSWATHIRRNRMVSNLN